MNDKTISIQISQNLSDKLADISKEYSLDSELLITAAIQKLLDDIEFIRDLRFVKRFYNIFSSEFLAVYRGNSSIIAIEV